MCALFLTFRSVMPLIMIVVLLVILSGCAGGSEGSLVSKAVPATDVGRMQAWDDAERVVALGEGRLTMIGTGKSMQPVYGEGTVLVLTKIDFADLKPGMQVAYVNDDGRQVLHVLIAYDPERLGWKVRGLNNESEDRARVTSSNLVGVVYASFAPGEGLK